MSKAFDTVNIHKLIHQLTLTNIPNIIIKFISKYIKGRQACTQYNGTLSKLKRIDTGVPQGEVLFPILFNLYISNIPLSPKDVQITTYADDITITASHTKHCKDQQLIQLYFHKIYKWITTNNFYINTDKTTTTVFTPDPTEYSTTLSLKLNNQTLPTTRHPKILGITLDPKPTFSQHINLTITKTKQTLNILKALTSTKWGKQKELMVSIFKVITRPILKYANTIWSPIISNTNIKKLQTFQNTALRIATGCTRDTNTQHLHDKTKVLPMDTHLKLHATQLKQLTQTQTHSLHDLNAYLNPPRYMKTAIYHNNEQTNIIISKPCITPEECRENLKHIHTNITLQYLSYKKNNKLPTPHHMIFIYQNKNYNFICVQNWHS